MTERDPLDEKECVMCGALESACLCTRRAPTEDEIEAARQERLTRGERARSGGARCR